MPGSIRVLVPITIDLMTRAAVITISDSCSQGSSIDLSGPAVAELLRAADISVTDRPLIPDRQDLIEETLRHCCESAALVVTTGGTGLAPSDVTPEATIAVCERVLDGLAELMRAEGRKETPFAALGRGVCGCRGTSLIVNLPGSPRGAISSLRTLLPLIPHALALLAGGPVSHDANAEAPVEALPAETR